jgi:ATP-binding cassette subfamily F protein 3
MILDEPTNHSTSMRATLVEEINDYTGAVVLVSHDRVLDACANRLWLVADGTVKSYDGDLDDYRRQVLSGVDGGIARRNESPADKAARKEDRKASAARRELAAPLRKQIKTLEAEIVRLEKEIAALDLTLAAPDLYASKPAELAGFAKRRADAVKHLAAIEENWLGLNAEYENPGSAVTTTVRLGFCSGRRPANR